jgi:hypothetical protein
MFPDPLFAVPDVIPEVTVTMLPALLAGPGAVAILVVGAVAIAALSALVRATRGRARASEALRHERFRASARLA